MYTIHKERLAKYDTKNHPVPIVGNKSNRFIRNVAWTIDMVRKNSDAIKKETLKWIESIKGFHDGTLSELNFDKDAYVLRIPTGPIRVKNEINEQTLETQHLRDISKQRSW